MNEFTELPQFQLKTELIRLVDEEICRRNQVVVLGPLPSSSAQPISLGMLNPSDDKAVEEVERILSRKVRRIQLNSYEIDTAISFGFGAPRVHSTRGPAREEGEAGRETLMLNPNCRIRFDRDQEPNEILEDTLSEAILCRATDIHIEAYEHDVDLRFRIDGVMHQITTPLSVGNLRGVISRIKILCDLDITDHHHAQDGRLNAFFTESDGGSRRVSFRVAILPGPFGEDVVLRLLDEGRTLIGLSELGMNLQTLEEFREMIKTPGGMILVTGPTASGKTTTLYAAIQAITVTGKKILTVEDPIEFEIQKVNQKQVTPWLSYADYARAFMRQNPDVLMIGEIRDEETASVALKAAQMGHLVFSTLHTPDALAAIGRLVMLGVDKGLLMSSLLGVLSQRLVRKACPGCSENYRPESSLLAHFPGLPVGARFVRGKGCPKCGDSGFFDRIGVFELLKIEDSFRDEIALSEDFRLEELSRRFKFERMMDDSLRKVLQGITTLEEVVRVVPGRPSGS